MEKIKSYSLQAMAWRRLRKNKPAVASLMFVIICIITSMFCYVIVGDNTTDSNTMIPQLSLKDPGFSIKVLKVKKDVPDNDNGFLSQLFLGKNPTYELLPITFYDEQNNCLIYGEYKGEGLPKSIAKKKYTDILFSVSPIDTSVIDRNDSVFIHNVYGKEEGEAKKNLFSKVESENIVTQKYLLGSDQYGRDIFSRLLVGLRISLSVGFIAVIISLFIGILFGSLAGYFQGKTDFIISWLINVMWAIPTILIVFALTLAIGKGFWQIFLAVGLTMWVSVARLVRGQVMVASKMEYVEAARSLGYSHFRTLFKHILPNIMGPVLVIAASNFATAILIEAGLSFLGLGVQPPTPSWGSMLRENYGFIVSGHPLMAIIPGLSIVCLVLAFNVLGNGLRDALDVKSKS